MSSERSLDPQQILNKVMSAGLSRWKIETLTGLLGFRSLQHHQGETEKNLEAENKRVRSELWGDDSKSGGDMGQQGHTILGDYNPPQVIVAGGQPSSGTLGKVLAGAALGAAMLGVPAAGVVGYVLAQQAKEKPDATEDTSLDIGLGRLEDLIPE